MNAVSHSPIAEGLARRTWRRQTKSDTRKWERMARSTSSGSAQNDEWLSGRASMSVSMGERRREESGQRVEEPRRLGDSEHLGDQTRGGLGVPTTTNSVLASDHDSDSELGTSLQLDMRAHALPLRRELQDTAASKKKAQKATVSACVASTTNMKTRSMHRRVDVALDLWRNVGCSEIRAMRLLCRMGKWWCACRKVPDPDTPCIHTSRRCD